MQIAQFSDCTEGFVYTAIRARPLCVVLHSSLLCFSKCTLRIWREAVPTISLLEPQRSATLGFCFVQRPQMWLFEQEKSAFFFEIILWPEKSFYFKSFWWTCWIIQYMRRRTIFSSSCCALLKKPKKSKKEDKLRTLKKKKSRTYILEKLKKRSCWIFLDLPWYVGKLIHFVSVRNI